MPQTEFFAEIEDVDTIVEICLETRFQIIPDLRYLSENYARIRDFDDFKRYRSETAQFFLWHDDFARCPLTMVQIEGEEWNRGKYMIQQRKGGPTLTLLTGCPAERDGIRWLSMGLLSYYPSYENTLTRKHEKPSPLLIAKFNCIKEDIVKNEHVVEFECITGGYRKFWILPHAYESLRRGAKLAMTTFEGLDVKGLDQFPNAL